MKMMFLVCFACGVLPAFASAAPATSQRKAATTQPAWSPVLTERLSDALKSPRLRRAALRFFLDQPYLFRSADPVLQGAARDALTDLMTSKEQPDRVLVLDCLEKLQVGVPDLTAWLRGTIDESGDVDVASRAYSLFLRRQTATAELRDLIRKRFASTQRSGDVPLQVKHIALMKKAEVLQDADVEELRRILNSRPGTFKELHGLRCLVEIDRASEVDISRIRTLSHSDAVGLMDRTTAMLLLIDSGGATTGDALDMFEFFAVQRKELDIVLYQLHRIPGARDLIHQVVQPANKEDLASALQAAETLAQVNLGMPDDVTLARRLLHSDDQLTSLRAAKVLTALEALRSEDVSYLRPHLASQDKTEVIWTAARLQSLHAIEPADLNLIRRALDVQDVAYRLQLFRTLHDYGYRGQDFVDSLSTMLSDPKQAFFKIGAYDYLSSMGKATAQNAEDLRAATGKSLAVQARTFELLYQSGFARHDDFSQLCQALMVGLEDVTEASAWVFGQATDMHGNCPVHLSASLASAQNGFDTIVMSARNSPLVPRLRQGMLAMAPLDGPAIAGILECALSHGNAADECYALALVCSGSNGDLQRGIMLVAGLSSSAQDSIEAATDLRALDSLWKASGDGSHLHDRLLRLARSTLEQHKIPRPDPAWLAWQARVYATQPSTSESGKSIPQKEGKVDLIFAIAFGVAFVVAILVLAIFFPHPSDFQYFVFRVVLAMALAGVAATVPGFLQVELGKVVRAGGAIGVFIIVFFWNPAKLAAQRPATRRKP